MPASALSLGGVVSKSHRSPFIAVTVAIVLAPLTVAAAQSSTAISPFVSYVNNGTQNPLAGLALTFGGTTGLALRASGDMSVANLNKTTVSTGATSTAGGLRPWGADADAMLFLGGIGGGATLFSRSLSPYVFSGIGLSGGDTLGSNAVRNGWSYGAGATIPLGFDIGVFSEARWRMSEYVLPTSKMAPDSRRELRFGLSFSVGGGSREPAPAPRGVRRQRLESYDDDVVERERVIIREVPVITTTPSVSTETASSVDVNEAQPVYRPSPRARSTASGASSTTVTRRASSTVRRSRGIVYRSRTASAKTQSSTESSTQSKVRSKTQSDKPATTASSRRSQMRKRP